MPFAVEEVLLVLSGGCLERVGILERPPFLPEAGLARTLLEDEGKAAALGRGTLASHPPPEKVGSLVLA